LELFPTGASVSSQRYVPTGGAGAPASRDVTRASSRSRHDPAVGISQPPPRSLVLPPDDSPRGSVSYHNNYLRRHIPLARGNRGSPARELRRPPLSLKVRHGRVRVGPLEGWERSARATVLDPGFRPSPFTGSAVRRVRPPLRLLAVLLDGSRSADRPLAPLHLFPSPGSVQPRLPGHTTRGRRRPRRGDLVALGRHGGAPSAHSGQRALPRTAPGPARTAAPRGGRLRVSAR